MLTIAIGVVLVAHGIGHVFFLAPSLRLTEWAGQTSESWLLTDLLGEALTRAIASVAWASTTVLFLVGAFGLMSRQRWWRTVLIVAAVVSLATIVVMWNGIATGNAFMAGIVDIAVIGTIAWAIWPMARAAAP